MDDQDRLLTAAWTARTRAYAPYSRFAVGAAVLTREGSIFLGANVENASYGLTLCAERAALSRALQEGCRLGDITAIAVVADAPTVPTPCGACRQWLAELAPDAVVYCAGTAGAGPPLVTTVGALLPLAFGPRALET